MSAQATLAGLFPPSTNQIWNEHLDWLPIPVHTEPIDLDYRLILKRQCQHFDYVMIQYLNTTAYKHIFDVYRPLITYLEAHSGMNLTVLSSIGYLYDTLLVEELNGRWAIPIFIRIFIFIIKEFILYRLPSWAAKVMLPGGEFERITVLSYELWTELLEMKKLRSGFLLKEIFDRFSNKTQSKLSPDRSLWMYFAHDFTISSMLHSLGMSTV